MLNLEIVRNIFNIGISSSIGNLEIGMNVCDYLKKHTILGFFSKPSIESIYNYIYDTKEQDLKLDFIFTMYNSLVENDVIPTHMELLVNEYYNFLSYNNLEKSVKDLYQFSTRDKNIDRIIFTLYFIRLYLEQFESVLLVIYNKNNKKG